MGFRPSPYKRTGTVITTGSQIVAGPIRVESDGDASTIDAIHITSEISTPSAPANGEGGILYVKSDGKPYWISSELSETDLTSGSSGGGGGGGGSGGSGTVSSSFNNNIAFYTGSAGADTTGITGSFNFYWDNDNNRLGLGTSTPEYALQVSGNIGVTGSVPKIYGSSTSQKLQLSKEEGVILSYGASKGEVLLDANVYLQTQNAVRFTVLDADHAKVGVGTAAPGATLDVLDNSSSTPIALKVRSDTSANSLVVLKTGAIGINTASPDVKLHIAQASDEAGQGLAIYNTADSDSIKIWVSGSERRIDADGTQAISIADSGVVTFPQGITNSSFDGLTSTNNGIITGSLTVTGSDNTTLFAAHSPTNESILTVTGSGKVGINLADSSEPSASLHIRGDARLESTLRLEGPSGINFRDTVGGAGNDAIITYSSGLTLRNMQNTPISLKTQDIERMAIDGTGGVKVSSSAARLEVTGSGKIIFGVHSTLNTNILTVTGSGKVGVNGLPTHDAQLSVSASSDATSIPFGIYGNDVSSTKAAEFKVVGNTKGQLYLYNGGSTVFSFNASSGATVLNDAGLAAGDTRIESDNQTHMLFVDAGVDRVGINTSAPTKTFTAQGGASFTSGSIIVNDRTEITGSSWSIASSSKTQIDSFSTSFCNAAKYTIHGIDNTNSDREVAEVILYHSGTYAHISRTFTDYTGDASFLEFSGSVAGGEAKLHVTCTNNNNTITFMRNSLLA